MARRKFWTDFHSRKARVITHICFGHSKIFKGNILKVTPAMLTKAEVDLVWLEIRASHPSLYTLRPKREVNPCTYVVANTKLSLGICLGNNKCDFKAASCFLEQFWPCVKKGSNCLISDSFVWASSKQCQSKQSYIPSNKSAFFHSFTGLSFNLKPVLHIFL